MAHEQETHARKRPDVAGTFQISTNDHSVRIHSSPLLIVSDYRDDSVSISINKVTGLEVHWWFQTISADVWSAVTTVYHQAGLNVESESQRHNQVDSIRTTNSVTMCDDKHSLCDHVVFMSCAGQRRPGPSCEHSLHPPRSHQAQRVPISSFVAL